MNDDPPSSENKEVKENQPSTVTNKDKDNGNGNGNGKSNKQSSFILKIIGNVIGRKEESVRSAIEELIEESLEETGDEAFSLKEYKLIENILKLHDLRTIDVMTPRVDIVSFPVEKSFDDLMKLVKEKGFSRIPIYKKTLDDIVGIAHVKDMVSAAIANKKPSISEIMNPNITFVSPAMRILDLLQEMQIKRNHMVMVVDEYGGIDGLVTIEDLVEQVVGEIEDEHDLDKKPDLIIREDGTIEADARAELEDFEKITGPILTSEEREDEDIDTIGGLVTQIAGRIPARGEIITHSSGTQFRIIEVDPRKIKRITVFNLPTPPNPDREPID